MMTPRHNATVELPVDSILPSLLDTLRDNPLVILEAPPGAGKTTRVPLALLDLAGLDRQRIVMLEPRRIAAVNAADFMARQLGGEVGATVGYTIRYQRRVTGQTRIEVVTEGVLTRRLQSDPELTGVGVVIFDEFHERSLNSDLALALCLDAQRGLRPDLKIIIMSATLESHELAMRLGDTPVIRSEGRSFPVELSHATQDITTAKLSAEAVAATGHALRREEGDILLFLPGAVEIDRAVKELRRLHPEIAVYPLYGGLELAQQRRAIEPGVQRKVVVATNVAETSLTIDGIGTVIDGGFEKRPRFDAARGLTLLETVRISQASAAQRAGRAGRLAPGSCHRLWSKGTDGALLPQAPPEIAVADLAQLALDLAQWGVTDANTLCWVDPPPAGHLAAARELLQQLGALNEAFLLTDLGRRMAVLPTHPRLARLLLQAQDEGCAALGADLAALLGEGPLRGGLSPALRQLAAGQAPATVKRAARYWRQHLACADAAGSVADYDEAQISRLLAVAWPDHIAQKRQRGDLDYLLANGMAAKLDAASPLRDSDLLVVVDLRGRSRAEVRIATAAPLPRADFEELFGKGIDWQREVTWQEAEQRVTAQQVRRHGALLLQSRPAAVDAGDLRAALLAWIAGKGLSTLPWDRESEQLRDRLRFLNTVQRIEGIPDCSEAALLAGLGEWLGPLLDDVRSAAQLKKIDLKQALLSRLDWSARKRLDELAPERLTVPSGSNIRIDYSGSQPVLAVKLQELFGLTASPRIAGDRVAVLLHLLSPAGRPLQVTEDLQSFWENGYAEVKKEMRGRYPKHPWPDDPFSAAPTRRTKRRR